MLSMFAMIINKLHSAMEAHVPAIFAATFEGTLDMIKGNYVDFPEHRLHFFALLQVWCLVVDRCWLTMSSAAQSLAPLRCAAVLDACTVSPRSMQAIAHCQASMHIICRLITR